jgi:hypothetical protein
MLMELTENDRGSLDREEVSNLESTASKSTFNHETMTLVCDQATS